MAVNPSIQLGTSGNWAIKEDNLLAYKQLGNKFFDREFDFSRGTRATFVGRNGLIQESGLTDTELVTNGDFATDSDWVKGDGWTISGGTANQDGSNGIISQPNVAPLNTKFKVTFDLTNYNGNGGLNIKLAPTQYNVTLNGNGTYNIFTDGTNTLNDSLQIISNNGFVGSITNVSVKEIQLDVPRIDFTDDPTGHLLLEPQSTNLLSYSEDFNNNYWSRNANVTTTNSLELAPNGRLDAQIVKYDGTGYSFIRRSLSPVPSTAATLSVFAKKGNWRYLGFRIFSTQGSSHTTFDFDTETFVNIHSAQTASFETFSNGWYRIKVDQPSPELNNLVGFALSDSSGSELNTTGGQVANVHLFGAQLEESSYATSYIPTSGSISTRNQELCNNSGTVNDFNSEEGVLYAEIAALADDLTFREITLSDGTSDNRVELRFRNNSNEIQAIVRAIDGAYSVVLGSSAYTITSFNKIAISYKLNDFNFWINGVKIGTDNSGVTPIGLSELAFDANGSDALPFFGKTKNVKAFKRALTDTELYLLTVTQYQSYQEMATALNYTL
jgi:hypothetical protein